MIERLIIKNYRSIESLDLRLGKMNAFIGPNDSGKTNIMTALNIVLNEYYPSVRLFDDSDFFNYVQSKIEIKAIFDCPLSNYSSVHGFCIEYDGNDFRYMATDNQGNIAQWPDGNDIRVNNKMRDEVSLMYVGVNRQASQQIKPTKWTIFGKILKHIEANINDSDKTTYKSETMDVYDRNIKAHLSTFKDIMKRFTKEHTDLDIDFIFSPLDPTEVLKNIRPYVWDSNLSKNFDIERVGLGVQSALAIALARAYAQIVKKPLILAIEEPELYLHPHACRHFYSILQTLANDGFQICLTTHNRAFVDMTNHQSLHLVRKQQGKTMVKSGSSLSISPTNRLKLASVCDDRINEIFFANYVILVEGPVDKIACYCALKKQGCDMDKNNASIIECGGKNEINYIAELLKHFEVNCCTLFDEDPRDPTTLTEIQGSRRILGTDKVFLQSPNLEGLLGISQKWNKKEALTECPEWFRRNPIPQVYIDLKNRIFGA